MTASRSALTSARDQIIDRAAVFINLNAEQTGRGRPERSADKRTVIRTRLRLDRSFPRAEGVDRQDDVTAFDQADATRLHVRVDPRPRPMTVNAENARAAIGTRVRSIEVRGRAHSGHRLKRQPLDRVAVSAQRAENARLQRGIVFRQAAERRASLGEPLPGGCSNRGSSPAARSVRALGASVRTKSRKVGGAAAKVERRMGLIILLWENRYRFISFRNLINRHQLFSISSTSQ